MKKKISTLLLGLATMLSLASCGKTSVPTVGFETSLDGVTAEVEDVIHIKVKTTTKHSVKEMVSALEFYPNSIKDYKEQCTIVWNDYFTAVDSTFSDLKKDSHVAWFTEAPTRVFDMDSKKAAVTVYAENQEDGQMDVSHITDIQKITGHTKDKFIFVDMQFKPSEIINNLVKDYNYKTPDAITGFEVRQYRLGSVDNNSIAFKLNNVSNVWEAV